MRVRVRSVPQCSTGCRSVSQGPVAFHRDSQGFAGFQRVVKGHEVFYKVPQYFPGFQRVSRFFRWFQTVFSGVQKVSEGSSESRVSVCVRRFRVVSLNFRGFQIGKSSK